MDLPLFRAYMSLATDRFRRRLCGIAAGVGGIAAGFVGPQRVLRDRRKCCGKLRGMKIKVAGKEKMSSVKILYLTRSGARSAFEGCGYGCCGYECCGYACCGYEQNWDDRRRDLR